MLRVVSELELWFGKVELELSLLNRSRLARHDRVDVIIANYRRKKNTQEDRTGQDGTVRYTGREHYLVHLSHLSECPSDLSG